MDINQALHILKRDDLAWNTLNEYVQITQIAQNFRDNEANSANATKIPCVVCGGCDAQLVIICVECAGLDE